MLYVDLWQLWDCACKPTLILPIQRCQNIALCPFVAAYWYDCNEIIYRDLMMTSVQVKITKFTRKHKIRLNQHTNPVIIQLLDNFQVTLKRRRPYGLASLLGVPNHQNMFCIIHLPVEIFMYTFEMYIPIFKDNLS